MQELRVIEAGVVEVQIGIAIAVAAYLALIVATSLYPNTSTVWRGVVRCTAVLLPFLPVATMLALDLSPDNGAVRAINVASLLHSFYLVPSLAVSFYLLAKTARQ